MLIDLQEKFSDRVFYLPMKEKIERMLDTWADKLDPAKYRAMYVAKVSQHAQ